MIPRYTRPEMAEIWSSQSRYRIWYEIEAHACDAQAARGAIPQETAKAVWKVKDTIFDIDRIMEIEAEVHHDVIAFLTYLAEIVGPQARFVHQGLTSSDVLDTCLAIQLVRATDLLDKDLDRVLSALRRRAYEHRYTLCIGRSHGIHAEPTSFGIKLAQAYAEMERGKQRLRQARQEIAVCAISGAVGTYTNLDPSVEIHVAQQLGLKPETISSQVIPRDRHAAYFCTLAVIASSIERIATEIRHLQRTEVGEVEEWFAPNQKGSSAMPHKRNPVLSENLVGLARLVRMTATPALENIALWHERDISHSSVERGIAPDATSTLDFALIRLAEVIESLQIRPDVMARNLDHLGGAVYSGQVLLLLTQKGLARETAYQIVQAAAMQTLEKGVPLLESLCENPEVANYTSREELEPLFDPAHALRHVDTIFARVFGKDNAA